MYNGLKSSMTELIEKLIEVTGEAGWTFEIQAKKFPITITFFNNQTSMFEYREEPPKIRFVFGNQIVYETDKKAKITRDLFSKFEKISKDIVTLYYILFHACIEEYIQTMWETCNTDRVGLIDRHVYDGIFRNARAEEYLQKGE